MTSPEYNESIHSSNIVLAQADQGGAAQDRGTRDYIKVSWAGQFPQFMEESQVFTLYFELHIM